MKKAAGSMLRKQLFYSAKLLFYSQNNFFVHKTLTLCYHCKAFYDFFSVLFDMFLVIETGTVIVKGRKTIFSTKLSNEEGWRKHAQEAAFLLSKLLFLLTKQLFCSQSPYSLLSV